MTNPVNIRAYDHVAAILQEAAERGGLYYTLANRKQAEQWRNLAYRYRAMTGRYLHLILSLKGDTVIIRPRRRGRATDLQGRDVHV